MRTVFELGCGFEFAIKNHLIKESTLYIGADTGYLLEARTEAERCRQACNKFRELPEDISRFLQEWRQRYGKKEVSEVRPHFVVSSYSSPHFPIKSGSLDELHIHAAIGYMEPNAPESHSFLNEAHRVLKAGGKLYLSDIGDASPRHIRQILELAYSLSGTKTSDELDDPCKTLHRIRYGNLFASKKEKQELAKEFKKFRIVEASPGITCDDYHKAFQRTMSFSRAGLEGGRCSPSCILFCILEKR